MTYEYVDPWPTLKFNCYVLRFEYSLDLREELAGGWRRLHNEELHNLYASPNIIRVIKSRRIRWAGHVERTRKMRKAYTIFVGKPERMRTF
jgi:hypothetical protein